MLEKLRCKIFIGPAPDHKSRNHVNQVSGFRLYFNYANDLAYFLVNIVEPLLASTMGMDVLGIVSHIKLLCSVILSSSGGILILNGFI